MSTYEAATTSMRETTKWLVTLIPGAGSILVIANLVPSWSTVVASEDRSETVIAALAVTIVVLGLTVWCAVDVLRTDVPGWGVLQQKIAEEIRSDRATDPKSLHFKLDASGVTRLSGYRSYSEVSGSLISASASADSDVATAATSLVGLADYFTTLSAFRRFLVVAGLAVVTTAGAFIYTSVDIADRGPSIDKPTKVEIQLTEAGRSRVQSTLKCEIEDGATLTGVATSGPWSDPTVVLTGDSCELGPIDLSTTDGVVVPAG